MDMMLRPARHAATVAPNDSNDLAKPATKGLYIGTAGALKVTCISGNVVTIPQVSAGHLNLQVQRVWATGTTATNIVSFS